MKPPVFVTRVNVGKGRGMVLISLESPGGDISNGEVENLEAFRVVMSAATFAEVTQLFVNVLTAMGTQPAPWAGQGEPRPTVDTFAAAGASSSKH
jgi:hypothetical protein